MRKWRNASVATTAAAIMLTTACGAESGPTDATGVQPAGQAGVAPGKGNNGYGQGGYGGAAPQGGKSPGTQPAGQLMVGTSKKLGSVLTDSNGFTLYRFDQDSSEPPKSACVGDCATTWSPVPAADVSSAAGIDSSLLGEVTRADGTQQLTVAGWPMYRYAKDTKPWQVKGEGVGGTWSASAPDGTKASGSDEAGGGTGVGGGGGGGAEAGAGGAGAGPGGAAAGKLPALSTFNDPKLGEILRDGKGRTLYRFDKDSAWPMKSNCTGACLDTWKPAKPVDKADVEGVDPELLTTFTRPEGEEQLAIDCWLLYWYTGDEKPGDTNGQGVGESWSVVAPDGEKVE
ncbi:SCO0930 family lipoprotein [Streptomyces sp. NPDC002055]|uniref:SCO0930 family lipoprotein n=1 Tax=Streptomyces sp. NPDC002055 TaxID=3154534 RepID=UPI003321F2E2